MQEPIYAWEEEMLRVQEWANCGKWPERLEEVDLVFKPYTSYYRDHVSQPLTASDCIYAVTEQHIKQMERAQQRLSAWAEKRLVADSTPEGVREAQAVQRAYLDSPAFTGTIVPSGSTFKVIMGHSHTSGIHDGKNCGTVRTDGYADGVINANWNAEPIDYLPEGVPQRALIKWKDQRGGQSHFEKWEPIGKEKALNMLRTSYPQDYDTFVTMLRRGMEIQTKNYYLKLERY